MADVAKRLRKGQLYSLSPPVPMAVLTLLHECYGQQVMRSPIYGNLPHSPVCVCVCVCGVCGVFN